MSPPKSYPIGLQVSNAVIKKSFEVGTFEVGGFSISSIYIQNIRFLLRCKYTKKDIKEYAISKSTVKFRFELTPELAKTGVNKKASSRNFHVDIASTEGMHFSLFLQYKIKLCVEKTRTHGHSSLFVRTKC